MDAYSHHLRMTVKLPNQDDPDQDQRVPEWHIYQQETHSELNIKLNY